MAGVPDGLHRGSRPTLGHLVETRAGTFNGHPVLLGIERGAVAIAGAGPAGPDVGMGGVEHLLLATPVRADVTWAATRGSAWGMLPVTPCPAPPQDIVAVGLWGGMGVARVAKGGDQAAAMRYLVSIADALKSR